VREGEYGQTRWVEEAAVENDSAAVTVIWGFGGAENAENAENWIEERFGSGCVVQHTMKLEVSHQGPSPNFSTQ
jgi:hypothetical protein